MSFQKYKNGSYCDGGRHKSGRKNLVGEITFDKNTGKEIKLSVGKCVICDKKNQ